ncbi:unnamed protein product [Heterobilharzia americana]|nr:unnamed protein product [Heterobilharzia americana]
MLHRPSLMPSSMKSSCKLSVPTNASQSSSHSMKTEKPISSQFFDYANDDEIIVLEPTDPDEDRLKQEEAAAAAAAAAVVVVEKTTKEEEEEVEYADDGGNHDVQMNTVEPPTSTNCIPVFENKIDAPTVINQVPITVTTRTPRTIGILPLNDTVQTMLTSTPRTPIQTVSFQPILPARVNSTGNAQNTCVVSTALPTVWLHSPIANTTSISLSNVTNTVNELTNNITQNNIALNPLVAAVLVNCATVNMISQLAGSMCTPTVSATTNPNSSSVVNTPNGVNTITIPSASLLPNLLSSIPLSTYIPGLSFNANTGVLTTPNTLSTNKTMISSTALNTNNIGSIIITPSSIGNTSITLPSDQTTSQADYLHLSDSKNPQKSSGRIKRFKCPLPNCEMSFYSRFNQMEHIRTHTGERPFTCPEPQCTAAFKRRRDLRDHWNMHLLDNPPSATLTEEEFNKAMKEADEKYNAMYNLESFHLNNSVNKDVDKSTVDKIDTPQTSVVIPDPRALFTKRSVNELGRYHCTYPGCDKSYARRHRLNQHISTHTGTGPIPCDEPNCHVRYFQRRICNVINCHIYMQLIKVHVVDMFVPILIVIKLIQS